MTWWLGMEAGEGEMLSTEEVNPPVQLVEKIIPPQSSSSPPSHP